MLIFPTPIRSLGTKWSRMQNKSDLPMSRRGSCVRTRQRELSHSSVLAARVGMREGERHGCMLVSRDGRRDRKTVLVRSASAATRKALQRQALGAAGAAAAIAADGACVIARSMGSGSCFGSRDRHHLLRDAPRRFLRFRFVLRERNGVEAGTKAVGEPRPSRRWGSPPGSKAVRKRLTKACAEADNPIRLG